MKILSTQEMQAADKRTADNFGMSFATLMENAGAAVARFILQEVPSAKRIVVFCGKGNNGGDGLVAARHLVDVGLQTTVYLLGAANDVHGEARSNLDRLRLATFGTMPTEVANDAALASQEITQICASADLFVDAVLGTGFTPPMRGLAMAAAALVNRYPRIPVVSVDLPSGWDADSREFLQPGAYRSDAVVTFTAPKLAHVSGHFMQGSGLTRPGNLQQGPVVVADIGSPDKAVVSSTSLTWAGASKRLTDKPRSPDGNKGKFGHVLVVGGADGKAGAPSMASLAALRAGAGLVTAGVVSSILANVAAIAPELMTLPLLAGSSGALSSANLEDANLKHMTEKKSVIAIGPGLGEDPDAQDFVLGLIDQTELPIVIDADALNAIAQRKYQLNGRRKDGTLRTIVLTPHPGEMARLVGKSIKEIEADRENIARAYATTHQVILVLKGWRTIIAHPDGRLAINTTGNPGLAKGGSGDILTGIVAALVSQYGAGKSERGEDPGVAVEAAVYLHGLAADFAVAAQNEHTLLATDVIAHLWKAFRFRADAGDGFTWLQGLPGTLDPARSRS
jgi:hydroxyethylthiazole kinase-like uncharacterized protein yjeF